MRRAQADLGFTLAELLIALAILGIIATFTIPKILSTQQNNSANSKAKEAAGMISQAFKQHLLDGQVATNSRSSDLTQYMNYVAVDTSSQIDSYNGAGASTCSAANPCIKLHTGAVLQATNCQFSSLNSNFAIFFYFDPDGTYSGSTTGASKSVLFFINSKGKIATYGTLDAAAINGCGTYTPSVGYDPSWFSW
jgi:prepilin-type N-terminal cleavage/methylation domain-containing protein